MFEGRDSNEQITDIRQVPQMAYNAEANSKLSGEWRPMFVVMGSGANVVLLSDHSAMNRPVRWEVQRRLGELGIKVARVQSVTSEIVALMHKRDSSESIKAADDRGGADLSRFEKLAFELAGDAVKRGASDIHIETRDTSFADVFFRINGTRTHVQSLEFSTAKALCTVLYNSHGDATTKDVQWSADGVLDTVIEHETPEGAHIQLRFASGPIFPSGNFHCVMRLLLMDARSNRRLETLGFFPSQLDAIQKMLLGSNGMVALVGPTNSGKSTLMQALLTKMFDRRGTSMKLITVEDPVEYIVQGACQVGVTRNRKGSGDGGSDASNFTKYLRGVLRQDPDTVVIGEVRDSDTAEVLKDLVLAGRKVLTTLHTTSALWTFIRLKEIGVPLDLLTMPGFISGIVYQRLLPLLCPHCSIELRLGADRLPADLLARLSRVADYATDRVRVRGDGCDHCSHTGLIGRVPVCEIVVPDAHLLKIVLSMDMQMADAYWRTKACVPLPQSAGGGGTVLDHALALMRDGKVDPADIESNIAVLDRNYDLAMTASSELLGSDAHSTLKRMPSVLNTNSYAQSQHSVPGVPQ